MAKVNIPSFKLNNGLEIPALGYGTWLGFNENFKFSVDVFPKLKEALSYAIDIGYRHIDTAHAYRVEPEVGDVINQKIKDGVVKREELFVTTKIWNHHHREADVEVAVRGCLRRLNVDYIDLILMHWPMSISVNLNYGQTELMEYCRSQSVLVVAYSPFGTMVHSRSAAHTPEPKLDNPTMVGLAKKYGKTVTQITLRYLYQRGLIAIPKTITKERVLENASIFDFELDKSDTETLAKFDIGHRAVLPFFWQDYEHYPFEKVPKKMEIPEELLVWKNGYNKNID